MFLCFTLWTEWKRAFFVKLCKLVSLILRSSLLEIFNSNLQYAQTNVSSIYKSNQCAIGAAFFFIGAILAVISIFAANK